MQLVFCNEPRHKYLLIAARNPRYELSSELRGIVSAIERSLLAHVLAKPCLIQFLFLSQMFPRFFTGYLPKLESIVLM